MERGSLKVLTFDCYGTLIDWEAGILGVLRPIFAARGLPMEEGDWLELYAIRERYAEGVDGRGYRPYAQVLREVMSGLGSAYHLNLTDKEVESLALSLPDWPAFPDSIACLERLKKAGVTVGIISNVDDALFAETCRKSGLRPDWVVTAQTCQSYKPSATNFQTAERAHRLDRSSWIHAAQSLYHDIEPATRLGIENVWVDRRAAKKGTGATYPADAKAKTRVTSLDELLALLKIA